MNPEPLVRAIVAAMMLLEESEPPEVDPDTAERGLEHIGSELLQLTGADRQEFLDLVDRMAQGSDARTAAFLRNIPFSIGMTETP
jgi:hypothetical protein